MGTIDAMATLRQFGYEYVNVDDNWMEPMRDVDGNLQVRKVYTILTLTVTVTLHFRKDKFPSGVKYLADYAHSKGLKFGAHVASSTCFCSVCCCGLSGSLESC